MRSLRGPDSAKAEIIPRIPKGIGMEVDQVLEQYCELMSFIKLRTKAMTSLLADRNLPDFCVADSLQLQIRMISETLAVACLLVHGDIAGAQSSKLTKAYQADLIINALEKLHPRFYPRPVQERKLEQGGFNLADIRDEFLTKAELLKIYREAAAFLHAGSIRDFLSRKVVKSDFSSIEAWLKKLTTLLSLHYIYLADEPDSWGGQVPLEFNDGQPAPKFLILVQMNPEGVGHPVATRFETVGLADTSLP
jgi:hypothetical protein